MVEDALQQEEGHHSIPALGKEGAQSPHHYELAVPALGVDFHKKAWDLPLEVAGLPNLLPRHRKQQSS